MLRNIENNANNNNNIDKEIDKAEELLNENEDTLEEKKDEINELEEANKQYSELNDKYLRCLAEYDNFRKRTAKEKEKIFSDAIAYSVKGIFDILDNFQRALKCETKDVEMHKGFEMIFNQLNEMIKKLGIEEIQTEGLTFDPTLHNAVMHIEDEKYGPKQIVETLQKGYKIGDNIIRYAMVKVAN